MPIDIFATKGTEYLLTIVYFAILIAIVRFIAPRAKARPRTRPLPRGAAGWFTLRGDRVYHPGHSWVTPEGGGVVTVGLDDFTAQLVGEPDALTLPAVGAHVRQGETGWELAAGERRLKMVAPLEGEVVEVNPALQAAPRLAAADPYGAGWIMKLKTPNVRAAMRGLLPADLAAAWMRQAGERVSTLPAAGLGMVLNDGGTPIMGFGRQLGPEEWNAIARDCFLAD